jgi:hypothetical protein
MESVRSSTRRAFGILVLALTCTGLAWAGPPQGLPDLSGQWTGFNPAGQNAGVNTLRQNGSSIVHPNGQSIGATLADRSAVSSLDWSAPGRFNASSTQFRFEGGSMNGWKLVKEDDGIVDIASTQAPIDGTWADTSPGGEPNRIWVITKVTDTRFEGTLKRRTGDGWFLKVIGEFSGNLWSGKITCNNCTFDGWEAATFKLTLSDDGNTLSGGYTYWNNWPTYNYPLSAKRQ